MSDDKRSFRRFAAMLPESARKRTEAALETEYGIRERYATKREEAERIDRQRGRSPDNERVGNHALSEAYELLKRQESTRTRELRKPRGTSKRAERNQRFAERRRGLYRRMRAHVESYRDRLKSFGQHDADPVGIPPEVHRAGQLICSDPTGRNAKVALAGLPPAIARRIRNAALHPQPYGGRRKREGRTLRPAPTEPLEGAARHWSAPGERRWSHPAAIRTVAAGVCLFKLARRTRRDGFKRVTRGVPRAMVARLVADPASGVAPSLGALYGNMDGVPGAVRALAEARVLLIQQPPGSRVEACDRGPSGFAFNVYWFYPWTPRRLPARTDSDRELAELSAAGLCIELGLDAAGRGPPETAQPGA